MVLKIRLDQPLTALTFLGQVYARWAALATPTAWSGVNLNVHSKNNGIGPGGAIAGTKAAGREADRWWDHYATNLCVYLFKRAARVPISRKHVRAGHFQISEAFS